MNRSHIVPVSKKPGFQPMLARGLKTGLRDYLNMLAHEGTFEGTRILSQNAVREMEPIKNAHVVQPEYVYRV